MPHVVLLGDSIFDNAHYVPGGPSVIEHLRRILPRDCQATLLAVDGATAEDVARQLARMPAEATHLVVSVGGNNALGYCGMILQDPAGSYAEVMTRMDEVREEFRLEYREMLRDVLKLGKPTTVCTIYSAVPGLGAAERAGLSMFNEVILFEAFCHGLPVIDLRLICNEATDYAKSSPIEPSEVGGGKIARAIVRALSQDGLQTKSCRVFG
jgi:hypothetical protein